MVIEIYGQLILDNLTKFHYTKKNGKIKHIRGIE